MGWGVIGRLLWVMSTSRNPVRARARIGHWALAARTMPEASRRKVIEARLPSGNWPAKTLKVTAVDARTGELVVFDSAGESRPGGCGWRQLRGTRSLAAGHHRHRRFVDGGVRSVANADLAAGYERVVAIVAPVAVGIGHMTSPRRQAAALAAAAARVVLVRPDRAATHAIGHNVLDLSRRAAAAAGPAGPRPPRKRLRSGQFGRLIADRPPPSREAGGCRHGRRPPRWWTTTTVFLAAAGA